MWLGARGSKRVGLNVLSPFKSVGREGWKWWRWRWWFNNHTTPLVPPSSCLVLSCTVLVPLKKGLVMRDERKRKEKSILQPNPRDVYTSLGRISLSYDPSRPHVIVRSFKAFQAVPLKKELVTRDERKKKKNIRQPRRRLRISWAIFPRRPSRPLSSSS